MTPRPQSEDGDRPGCGRLEGRVAIVSGGDSGIGRAVAIANLTKAALPHLGEGAAIVNTTSVTAYEGSPQLI